ncbi:hypothetical protein JD844_006041, partial [Phrynosoma platyrhinos]
VVLNLGIIRPLLDLIIQMEFLHGSQQFLQRLFVGLVLASLCDAKVFLHGKGCGVPDMPVHGISQCQPPLCEEPLDSGMFKLGTLVEFFCQPGFALVGLPALAICQGGQWHTVRGLVCKPIETPHPTGLMVATSVPLVVAAALTLAALAVLAAVCVMLMTPTCSSCHCTEPANSAYEAMEDPEDVEDVDGEEADNDEGPLPSYEEAVGGHLGTSLTFGGHHSDPLVHPQEDLAFDLKLAEERGGVNISEPAPPCRPEPSRKSLDSTDIFKGWQISTEPLPTDQEENPLKFGLPRYSWCIKQQCIDLLAEGLWEELLDLYQPNITIMDWYENSKLARSVYELHVQLLGTDGTTVIREFHHVSHVFEDYGPGVRYVHFLHKTKDAETAAGLLRTRATDSSVSVQLRD